MYGISTRNLEVIRSYDEAHEYFTNRRKPRTVRWADNQRPLRDTRSTHMRIESGIKEGVHYYDLCLYRTSMIRFFKPNEAGDQAVHLLWHWSNSSAAFMYAQNWYGRKRMKTTQNKDVSLVISGESAIAQSLFGDEFTVRLVLDKDGRIDTERSVHIPIFSRRSSATLRAKRREFKERMSTILDLVEMRHSSFVDTAVLDISTGKPFSADNAPAYRMTGDELRKLRDGDLCPNVLTGLTHQAMEYGESAFHSIMNRRAYAIQPTSYWGRRPSVNPDMPTIINDERLLKQDPQVIEMLMPTPEDVRKSVLNRLLDLAGLSGGDSPKPYPQFASTMPGIFYGGGYHVGQVEKEADGINRQEAIRRVYGHNLYYKLVARKGVIY